MSYFVCPSGATLRQKSLTTKLAMSVILEMLSFHSSFFWGRANGWALLTACELLDQEPDATIMKWFKDHLAGLLPLQDIDGCWHQLLDNPQTYLETSCTAIYCYCLAHAINKGWLEPEPYVSQTLLAWNYIAAHGYAPVIWAGAEIYQMLNTLCLKSNDSAIHYYPVDPQTNEPLFEMK